MPSSTASKGDAASRLRQSARPSVPSPTPTHTPYPLLSSLKQPKAASANKHDHTPTTREPWMFIPPLSPSLSGLGWSHSPGFLPPLRSGSTSKRPGGHGVAVGERGRRTGASSRSVSRRRNACVLYAVMSRWLCVLYGALAMECAVCREYHPSHVMCRPEALRLARGRKPGEAAEAGPCMCPDAVRWRQHVAAEKDRLRAYRKAKKTRPLALPTES